MKSSIQKDYKRRRLVQKYEIKQRMIKALLNDLSLPIEERSSYMNELNRLPRNASKTRVVNRCILTGRSRGVYKFCKLSRIKFRELAAQGVFPGITKASW